MRPFTVLMLCVVLGNADLLYKNVIIKTFDGKNDSKFSNLAVDKDYGWVFVGDVNRLYQLNESLNLVVEYETGQKKDSLHFPMPNSKCDGTKNKTNNYNKALVLDYSTMNTRLISCGSVSQGLCEVHNNINNISSDIQAVYQSVAANDENSSTIAFIGPGPMDLSFSSLVLYVGATNTNNSNYQKQMPLVASRSLEKRNLLQIAKEGPVHGTKIISVDPKYTINYIFGFSSELFTYFLTTQMKSANSSSFVSKLIRICNEDDQYSSYTEIPIECTGHDGRNYNLAQAAFKTRLDSKFAKLLGLDISLDNDVLFVIFSQSEKIESDGIGKPRKYSALCVYSLKAINKKFVENIKFKFDPPNNPRIDDEDFNTQLQGSMPLRSEPLFTNNTLMLTAIAATPIDKVGLVVYLGTREGYLKEIVFENSTNPREIGDIFIGESSVNPHMQFDSRVNHLYVMTKNKLVKIKIHDGDKNENDAFSNCPKYTSCTACVSSRFRCNWCLTEHQCIYNEDKNAEYNSVLSSPFCRDRRGSIGPKYCPAVVSYGNGRSDTLIAAGTKKSIEFKTSMSAQFWKNKEFLCNFTIEGRIITVSAAFLNSGVIRCDTTEFTYSQHKPNLIVSFDVLWDNWKALDHHNNMQLVLYKCSEMASNCKICLTLRNEYECGWCGDKCQTFNGCRNRSYDWWGRNHSCSNTTITHFEPQYGWWNKQNNITIKGINLCSINDNVCNITVAGAPCIPMEHSPNYNPPTRIVCQINEIHKLLENKNNPGPVLVQMGHSSAKSTQNFTIIELNILDICPKRGPQSGGTELVLQGNFMHIENFIEVFIENITCRVFNQSSSEIKCYTGASKQEMSGDVDIKLNMNNKTLVHRSKKLTFKYLVDPTIESFEYDNDNLDQAPKSIPAGGIELHMRGTNFTIIQKPLFYVYSENMTKRYIAKCNVSNHSMMSCLTPLIPDISSSFINLNKPIRLNYGFQMDDVTQVQNISTKVPMKFKMLMLYPNPKFKSSPNEEIKTTLIGNKTILFIEGENINFAFRKTDIVVKVGNRNCEIEQVSADLITCRLFQPNISNWLEIINNDPEDVIVCMGQTFQANVGKLVKDLPNLMKYTLFGGGIILIIIAVAIPLTIICCKKFSKKSRDLKKVCKHLNELELGVAKECKAAFTDLHIEITDLTTNVTFTGIPFFDYYTYVMKTIFPDIKDHTTILAEKSETLDKEEGLQLLNQLVLNKTFLLLFIQTLENHKEFSMNERVHVASMVMIALQNDLEYCTSILKALLTQMIGHYIRGNNDPKLLFRQSGSIVEKMLTIWFSFLLHKFLKKRAGEPLYKLFCAIKQHVSKGPIDAVTFDARHSLSENKIIRQDFGDFKMLTIYVSVSQKTALLTGLELGIEEVPVKVLDCDTISQVKEKVIDVIYGNIRYSQRPASSTIDIEWVIDLSFKMLLSDYDSSSKVEREWRQLNTLHHYEVPDLSRFNLVSIKEMSMSNASTLRVNSIRTPGTRTIKSIKRKIASSLSTSAQFNETNYKTWHLVKPQDLSDINSSCKKGNLSDKLVSEIYLTRLLATKNILQKFVDDLFEAIFDANLDENGPPLAIKYLFDFLDDQALLYGVTDPDVVHAWKNNCLPLRYWVNLIKNPDFLLDVHKSNIVDSCLSVIAQAFMDSCSTSDHYLSKDSPASKLLYAKDIPVNRKRVKQYYADIKCLPAVPENHMNAMLNDESHLHECEFNTNSSLYALYEYAVNYNSHLMISLKEDEFAQKHKLMHKLVKVHSLMEPDLN